MFAVIKTGGKQYRVAANDVLKIEKVAGEVGDIIEIGQVLALGEGDDATFGAPFVDGAMVTAEVVRAGPRQDRHRLQEAPPPEFAPQARPSPARDHRAHRRDPARRRQAVEEGRCQEGSRSGCRAGAAGQEGQGAKADAAPQAPLFTAPAGEPDDLTRSRASARSPPASSRSRASRPSRRSPPSPTPTSRRSTRPCRSAPSRSATGASRPRNWRSKSPATDLKRRAERA